MPSNFTGIYEYSTVHSLIAFFTTTSMYICPYHFITDKMITVMTDAPIHQLQLILIHAHMNKKWTYLILEHNQYNSQIDHNAL